MRKFLKFIAVSFTIAIFLMGVTLLIGRSHFVLGSALSMGRWVIVFSGIAIIYINRKKFKRRHKLIMVLVGLILMEVIWVRIQKSGLDDPEEKKEISVMTYNLFFRNRSQNMSLKVIQKGNPDILFVQEVSPSWSAKLNSNLGGLYPYKVVKVLRGVHGIAVYSKFPLSEMKCLNSSSGLPYALFCTVNVGERKIRLCNMHLASPAKAVENPEHFYWYYSSNYDARKRQYQEVKESFENSKYKNQLLVGDFNTPDWEPLYRDMTYNWCDLYVKSGSGMGFSFPHSGKFKFPFLRLDYAMAKGAFEPVSSEVIEGGSSDHLAVKTVVKF